MGERSLTRVWRAYGIDYARLFLLLTIQGLRFNFRPKRFGLVWDLCCGRHVGDNDAQSSRFATPGAVDEANGRRRGRPRVELQRDTCSREQYRGGYLRFHHAPFFQLVCRRSDRVRATSMVVPSRPSWHRVVIPVAPTHRRAGLRAGLRAGGHGTNHSALNIQ